MLVRRDNREKQAVPMSDSAVVIEKMLNTIQQDLYKQALNYKEQYSFTIDDYEEFKVKNDDPGGFFWIHWCGSNDCENKLQEETKATIRCIPIDDHAVKEDGKCLLCGEASHERVVVAKAY